MKTHLKNLWRFIKSYFTWLIIDTRRVWSSIFAVVFVAVIALLLPVAVDERVKYFGLALQLFGIYTVLHSLRDRRILFNCPSFKEYWVDWLAKQPRWNVPVRSLSINEEITPSCSVTLSLAYEINSNASIEERLTTLEGYFKFFRAEQIQSSTNLQLEISKLTEELNLEHQSRELTHSVLRMQVDTLGAGGLVLEWAGVVSLLVGVVLGTIPDEIGRMISWCLGNSFPVMLIAFNFK